jgi:hypothetical protein
MALAAPIGRGLDGLEGFECPQVRAPHAPEYPRAVVID